MPARAWEAYQDRRHKADERRLEENERALLALSKVIGKLREEGYSMGDLGRELGMSRQAIYDLLRRARPSR